MFKNATYSDWEIEIKKFIKEQPIDSYYHEVAPGIKYNPFAVKENTPQVKGKLDTAPSYIGVEFSENIDNKTLLHALENGAQSIEITLKENSDLSALLKGVRLDIILPIVRFENEQAKLNFEHYLNDNYSNNSLKNSVFEESVKSPSIENQSFLFESEIKDSIVSLEQILLTLKQNPTSNPTLKIVIGNPFFLEIARLRALRILVANLYREIGVPLQSVTVIASVDLENKNGDYHTSLIHQTCAALSAKIGGANVVQLQKWEGNASINNERLSLNIQNILHLESHIDLYSDVMAGSYFIEDLTDKIAHSVWDKI